MATAPLFSVKAKEATVSVPAEWTKLASTQAIAQAFHVYRERSHTGLPQTQTRGQVSLTTKKMFKQKHTGNARHGSAKAPIFVGGGVTHGPKGVKTQHTLSSALRTLSRVGSIALKLSEKNVAFLDLSAVSKTKDAANLVAQTGATKAVVAISEKNWASAKAFGNLKNVTVLPWEKLYAYPVLVAQKLLIDSAVVETKAEKKETKPAKKATK